MLARRVLFILATTAILGWQPRLAQAGGFKISIPRKSPLTPVQRLNRAGVDAVRAHHYEKAKALFYQAYLYDPDDPFTLNNLGYMAELDSDAETAQRFYGLASQHGGDALIDKASSSRAEGMVVQNYLAGAHNLTQTGAANLEALSLLSKGRAAQAGSVLQPVLSTEAPSAFTLNNMGVAKERQGELEEALQYYSRAAEAPPDAEHITIASNKSWQEKSIHELALANARDIQQRLQLESALGKAVRLNLRGVFALNRNDWSDARRNFEQAYVLDQNYSFSLNNLAYVAEMDGDLETAQFYYEKAHHANRSDVKVGAATRASAEGKKLDDVASDNDRQVEAEATARRNASRQDPRTFQPQLHKRNGQPTNQPTTPN